MSLGLFAGTQLFAQTSKNKTLIVDQSVTIAENLHRSGSHSEFTQALKSSGIMQQLDGKGPYSVFALDDASWKKLPQMDAEAMNAFLKNHILPVKLDQMELASRLKANMGSFTVSSLNDVEVTLRLDGEKLILDIPGSEPEHVIIRALENSNGLLNATDYSL